MTRVDDGALRFEVLSLTFVPAEIDRAEEIMQRLGRAAAARFVGRLEDFERFFDVLLCYKEAADIHNTATAFLGMIEIVESWLAEHNAA